MIMRDFESSLWCIPPLLSLHIFDEDLYKTFSFDSLPGDLLNCGGREGGFFFNLAPEDDLGYQ